MPSALIDDVQAYSIDGLSRAFGGIPKSTLYQVIKKYQVPTFKMGKRTYIDVEDVKALKLRLKAERQNAPRPGRKPNQPAQI